MFHNGVLRRLLVHSPPDPVRFWSGRAGDPGWHSVMWGNAAYNELANADQWKTIERYLPKQRSSVLDLGCGTGRLSRRLCEHFDRYEGVDLPAMVNEAAQRNPELNERFVAASVFEYEYPEASFDLVLSMACLSAACTLERLDEVASSMVRSTRSSGRIVMLDAFHRSPLLARICRAKPQDVLGIFEGLGMRLIYWGGLHFAAARLLLARSPFSGFPRLTRAGYRAGELALRLSRRRFCDYSVIVLEKP